MSLDNFVPISNFGKDHWSTLAYAETVMVDMGGFQVGLDARMRQGRRNYRVMLEQCKKPKRIKSVPVSMVMAMDEKYSTILRDGSVVPGHDDWHCIQDMAEAGFFRLVDGTMATADRVQPGVFLHLTPIGRSMADAIRNHKASGGSFGTFSPTGVPV